MNKRVAVLGATGHTGSFVVAELRRRGLLPVPYGDDADAVINCAGPFAATAAPAIEAAIRAGVPYLDITAEIEVVTDTFAGFADADIPIVPAVGFFGGLGDLLATLAVGAAQGAEDLTLAYALSSWHPTPGTVATGRVSGQRRNGRRIAYTGGRLQYREGDAPLGEWNFPAPVGPRAVVGEFTTADSATIPSHLGVSEIHTFMTRNAVDDLHAAAAPADGSQTFLVEIVAGDRRAAVSGRDIYAVTAPLVVEAAVRILAGEGAFPGVASIGARFDPADFLHMVTTILPSGLERA